jgi:type II secretory pathway component PulF
MKEPDFTPNELISAIPRRKVRRGRGLSIRQLLFWVMFFAVAFAILRVFEGHIEVLIGLLIAFLISVGFGLSVSLMQRRAGMQEAFIEMVAISRQTGLPLAVGLSSFAPQCGRSYSRSLVRLRSQIESGMSLSDGVAVTYGVLPLEQRVHFRVAEFNGSRAESMQRIARNRFLRIESLKPLYDSIIYYLVVVWQVSIIIMFLSYFVSPKMQAIFKDLGVYHPPITEYFLSITYGTAFNFIRYPILGFLLFASLRMTPVIIGFLIIYLSWLFNSGRGMGFFGRFVPWMTTSERAGILRGLADTIRCNNPLDECLRIFSDWSMRKQVRRRCLKARRAMLAGTDWIESLIDEGILKQSEKGLIATSAEAGRASWALDQLAEAIEKRQWYRYRLLTEFLSPVMTLLIAGVVLLTASAFFAPLVKVIQILAS